MAIVWTSTMPLYNRPMKIKFTKMQGAGNDFVVIDAIHQKIDLSSEVCRKIADRRFGIGADQILIVEPSDQAGIDFRYRIFNADGGEVEQCGNGARAFVRFVTEKGLTAKTAIRVTTMSGIIEPRLEASGEITVDMGPPEFMPERVPFNAAGLISLPEANESLWPLPLGDRSIFISVVSMGNPHAVQIVPSVEEANVSVDGPAIEHHPRFPKRVNAGFMEIVDRHHIRLRVFERGAGETLACGTGSCAAVVAGIRRDQLTSPVLVEARGGNLTVSWSGGSSHVMLTGPAVSVFDGEITL
ncbi:diaminopimelate epimerase [Actimicrobium sp. GrIS 1.19]|nr:diaminopimelate epimerase [Actimicrobium sp. GrIS 1.19]